MRAIGILLNAGLVGAARDHLFHHHITTLLHRLATMWSSKPARAPDLRELHPAAWRLWFDGPAARAKRLLARFGGG